MKVLAVEWDCGGTLVETYGYLFDEDEWCLRLSILRLDDHSIYVTTIPKIDIKSRGEVVMQ